MVFARERGYWVVQAHPFRDDMTILPPHTVDMLEIYNGHPKHDSRNDIASLWTQKFGMIGSSGSDTHKESGAARGGVLLPEKPKDMHAFISLLRNHPQLIESSTRLSSIHTTRSSAGMTQDISCRAGKPPDGY